MYTDVPIVMLLNEIPRRKELTLENSLPRILAFQQYPVA